jgi:hypothetical protein
MRKNLQTALAAALCGATALTAIPQEALAGPTSVASEETVAPSSSLDQVRYRRYRYRRYGYDPSGAIFAGAALGLLGAGVAAATAPRYYGYGYPYYGYGYGYGYPYGYGWGW